jgi:hypothetical protein
MVRETNCRRDHRPPRVRSATVSTTAVSNILSILGGLVELGGLVLVALGVASNRKIARELEHESLAQTIYGAGGIESAEAFGEPTVTGGEEATTYEDVKVIRQRLARLERFLTDNARTTAREVREEAARRANEARQEAEQRHRRLQAILADVLAGDARRELAGVVLFAFGATLSVLANIVGNAA